MEDEDSAATLLRKIKEVKDLLITERAERKSRVHDLRAQIAAKKGAAGEPSVAEAPSLEQEVPQGFILWFHSQSLPPIYALSSSEQTHVLLSPPTDAPPLNPHLPVGVVVAVDDAAIEAALNPKLEMQMERLVGPGHLTPRQFWVNYFAHVQSIKAKKSAEAWVRATRRALAHTRVVAAVRSPHHPLP